MGLLKLVNDGSGIDFHEYRDDQYYNKYDYRLRATIPMVKYTWWCKNESELDDKIAGKAKRFGSVRKSDLPEVIKNSDALKLVIRLQNERKKTKNLGIRIEGNTVAFFSCDLSVLQNIRSMIGNQYECDYTQVQTSQYAGVKHFVRKPPHNFRVYLRSKRVDDNFHVSLKNMLDTHSSLHPSPALKSWINRDNKKWGIWHFRWTSAAHFIDYDDESTLSYLALMHGEILGKKYKLEKRPDNI